MSEHSSNTGQPHSDQRQDEQVVSRRGWMKMVGAGAALLGAGMRAESSTSPSVEMSANHTEGRNVDLFDLDDRIDYVNAERRAARDSFVSKLTEVEQTYNSDYMSTVELYGQEFAPFLFTKGMPLERDESGNPYPEGLVPCNRKLEDYWEPILEKGEFDESFTQGGQRLFIGVPEVHTVTHSGMDPWRGRMPPAPSPTGVRNAGEMIDLYAMEQLRDVPFVHYPGELDGSAEGGDGDSVQQVVDALIGDLNSVESKLGESWWYDVDRLFVEADTEEVDWGPYLSQYLLHDVNMWALPIEQQYRSYEAGADYNGTHSDWLQTLEGRDDTSAELNPNEPERDETSYISTGRDLATIVNAEPTYQEYLIAGLHLLEHGSLADGLPYGARDEGSVFCYGSSGPTGFFDILARGARQALLTAFYQKYYVHFRCRPETYSGRLHSQRVDGRDFGISSVLTNSAMLDARGGSDLLTTAYEEGSPVHPAYPSGHSVIAGTCGTILKVLFENTDWTENYYVPTPDGDDRERVSIPAGHRGTYQEIDKLMSNIGLARLFAGVHYYSDHYQGIKLGEQIAVGLLLDVFERAYTPGGEITATFTPFLDYDTEYDISIDTLQTLRAQSNSR